MGQEPGVRPALKCSEVCSNSRCAASVRTRLGLDGCAGAIGFTGDLRPHRDKRTGVVSVFSSPFCSSHSARVCCSASFLQSALRTRLVHKHQRWCWALKTPQLVFVDQDYLCAEGSGISWGGGTVIGAIIHPMFLYVFALRTNLLIRQTKVKFCSGSKESEVGGAHGCSNFAESRRVLLTSIESQ